MVFKKSHIVNIRKLLFILGYLIAFLSLFFIATKIYKHFSFFNLNEMITLKSVLFLFIGAIAFGFISILLALARFQLMDAQGLRVEPLLDISVFAKNQIEKYLPNNLFRIDSRQGLVRGYGHSHALMMKCTFWEIILHALAAGLLGGFILIVFMPSDISIFPAVLVTLILLIGLPALGRLIEKQRMQAFYLYAIFHLLTALIFSIQLNYFSPTSLGISSFCIAMGAYIIAWLIGFITPGVPSGLGIRELVLYMLISTSLGDSRLMMTLVYSRILTTMGDVFFFGFGYVLSKKMHYGFS